MFYSTGKIYIIIYFNADEEYKKTLMLAKFEAR